jgi:hypothetical protein
MTPKVHLREVAESDLPIFFEHQRDPLAVHMAAFTAKDPDARAAADNTPSLRVLQKSGFTILRQEWGYANARGTAIDEFLLALTS